MKKTVRGTVFSREVRSGYAARTDDARRSRGGIIPPAAPKEKDIRKDVFFLLAQRNKSLTGFISFHFLHQQKISQFTQ